MTAKSKGTARENLEGMGFAVARCAGSHGAADLWAKRHDSNLWLIQVKGNVGSPWMHFRRGEREDLVALADQTDGDPYLIHWSPHGEMRIYAEDEWPKTTR